MSPFVFIVLLWPLTNSCFFSLHFVMIHMCKTCQMKTHKWWKRAIWTVFILWKSYKLLLEQRQSFQFKHLKKESFFIFRSKSQRRRQDNSSRRKCFTINKSMGTDLFLFRFYYLFFINKFYYTRSSHGNLGFSPT